MHPRVEMFAKAHPQARAIDSVFAGLGKRLGKPVFADHNSGDRPTACYALGPSAIDSYVSIWGEGRDESWHARVGIVAYLRDPAMDGNGAEINILYVVAGRRWYGYFHIFTKGENCGEVATKRVRRTAMRLRKALGLSMRSGTVITKAEAMQKIRTVIAYFLAEKDKFARAEARAKRRKRR